MAFEFDFLKDLDEKQREICRSPENYVLTACPGSGKTRTITYRLAYLQQKYLPSRKIIIAITYTNRAANEINERLHNLGMDLSNIWAGTIHQFCMKYIIRPYSMYNERLSKGYSIIDEYVKKQYCDRIAEALGIDIKYKDPLGIPIIKENYEKLLKDRKEIDFDMILEISLQLLSRYSFIADNISHTIRSIHVDEFQDTNEKQYAILALIVKCNPSINTMFVGDVNQAIYQSLGGIPKTLQEIQSQFKVVFKSDCLSGCYRSTQRIVDFYTNFEVQKTGVKSKAEYCEEIGTVYYNYDINKDDLLDEMVSIIKEQLNSGIPEKEICIVAPQWYQIFPIAQKLRASLPDAKFDAPDIVPFKYDPMNPFFLFAQLIFTPAGNKVGARIRIASEVIDIMKNDYQILLQDELDVLGLLQIINAVPALDDGIDCFENAIQFIMKHLNVDFEQENRFYDIYTMFIEKAKKRITTYKLPHTYSDICSCFEEKDGIVVNTIHGIKGEEYTVVIGFDLLNGHLPHWDYIYNDDKKSSRYVETKKLLYVLCSRAKKKLFLFSEKGRYTSKGNEYTPTDELISVSYNYDC